MYLEGRDIQAGNILRDRMRCRNSKSDYRKRLKN